MGALLARLEERDAEIRGNLRAIVSRLGNGDFSTAKAHHPNWDETQCIPLIDDYVVVFRFHQGGTGPDSILLLTVEED